MSQPTYDGRIVDLDSRRPHAVGVAKCRACGHRQTSVVVAEVAEAPLQCAKCMAMACVFLRDGQDRPVRYEWRDGQLWDRARKCWVVWETISGKIGMANGMDRLVVRLLNDEPDRDMHLNGNERKLLEGQPFCPRCQNVTTPDVNGREFCSFCMATAGA